MVINQSKTETRTDWIKNLYLNHFSDVSAFISRHGGNLEEAKDIFQEAIVIYYEKSLKLNEAFHEKAYLMGIAKHLWYARLKDLARQSKLDEMKADLIAEKEINFSTKKVMNLLKSTSQKCLDLLEAFYYQKISLKTLAPKFGFSGERSAAVQKFKCLEKVRGIVKSKGLSYEDFTD
jgi:DNA-directed RNA polymerase specialized sigma24 family protein